PVALTRLTIVPQPPPLRTALLAQPAPSSALFPYTTLFRSLIPKAIVGNTVAAKPFQPAIGNQPNFKPIQYCNKAAKTNEGIEIPDRKSTRLNSSHVSISYAVFCLKQKIKRDQNKKHWHEQC